jgi:biopolymer transport protein ExbD
VLNVPRGIKLPISESESPNTSGVIVQVAPSKIYVDSNIVLDTEDLPERVYDRKGRRIIPLYNALVKKRESIEVVSKSTPKAKPFSGVVNLVVDKSLKYNYIKKLLYTCAEAGFKKYKFVVMGEE